PDAWRRKVQALERLVALRSRGLSACRAEPNRPAVPQEDQLRKELAKTRLALADLALLLRDHELVFRTLRDLAAKPADVPSEWKEYPRAALLAAEGLRLILQDNGPTAGERQRLAKAGTGLVLSLLQRAGERKEGVPASLFDHKAFAPLRDVPEF